MARRHGRNGRLYVALASAAATAEPVANLSNWSANFTTDKVDVTSFGDTNKQSVAGLPSAAGDFSGFWDDASAQLYTAATDGAARKFYLYPDLTNAAGVYWFGTAFFDFNVEGAVDGAVAVSGSWEAASAVAKVG